MFPPEPSNLQPRSSKQSDSVLNASRGKGKGKGKGGGNITRGYNLDLFLKVARKIDTSHRHVY